MKNALVTGVSWTTGIGFAVTQQLIKDGYFVYAIYHSEDSTAKEYFKGHHDSVKFIQCDLSDRESVSQLINNLSGVSLNAIVFDSSIGIPYIIVSGYCLFSLSSSFRYSSASSEENFGNTKPVK